MSILYKVFLFVMQLSNICFYISSICCLFRFFNTWYMGRWSSTAQGDFNHMQCSLWEQSEPAAFQMLKSLRYPSCSCGNAVVNLSLGFSRKLHCVSTSYRKQTWTLQVFPGSFNKNICFLTLFTLSMAEDGSCLWAKLYSALTAGS